MLTAIAIDDEPKALEIIQLHASRTPGLSLLASFRDATEAISWYHQHPVDVLFLDINLPNLSGLQVKDIIGEKPMIIFTTAYSEFAAESYDQGALDYLVKPIRFERFVKAVMRAGLRKRNADENEASQAEGSPLEMNRGKMLYVKSGTALIRIRIDDIAYLKKDGNYIFFHTTDGKRIMSRLTAVQALELLPADIFFQTHKSYIVALTHITQVSPPNVFIGKEEIPVAKDRWDEFMKRLSYGTYGWR